MDDVNEVVANVTSVNPTAKLVWASSPVALEPGPSLVGKRVLVVEDGPTITHGEMPYGAGTVAARQAGAAELVDPRPYAVGSIARTFETYPTIGAVLPAMGYSDEQLAELQATIDATECDVVVAGTPIDLARLITTRHPIRRATYELREIGEPTLASLIEPIIERARRPMLVAGGS
jgi:predicted GTPase